MTHVTSIVPCRILAAVDTLFSPDLVDHNPAPGVPGAIDGMRGRITEIRHVEELLQLQAQIS